MHGVCFFTVLYALGSNSTVFLTPLKTTLKKALIHSADSY